MKSLLLITFVATSCLVGVGCGDSKKTDNDVADDVADDVASDVENDTATADDVAGDAETPPDIAPDSGDDAVVPDDGADDVSGQDTAADAIATDIIAPPLTCENHGDCGRCAFPTAPATTADCYCNGCPDTVLPTAVCEFNRAAWQTVCGDSGWQPDFGPCPQPRCTVPQPTACIGDTCIDACSQADCPDLPCPLAEQVQPPGSCCRRCAGDDTCMSADDCTLCVHNNLPTTPEECACPRCPTVPMTAARCESSARAYMSQCDEDFQMMCPVFICLPQPPAQCGRTGYCEAEPFRCREAGDCVYCPWAEAPTNASECQCAGCGVAMTAEKCEFIREKAATVCEGFDFDGCAVPSCPARPELACDTFAGQCIMNFDFR